MHRETQNLMKFQRSVDFLNRRFVFKDINIKRFEVGQKGSFLGHIKNGWKRRADLTKIHPSATQKSTAVAKVYFSILLR